MIEAYLYRDYCISLLLFIFLLAILPFASEMCLPILTSVYQPIQ